MEKPKFIKKTVRLSEEIANYVNDKPKPSQFMRSAISNAIARESNPKTYFTIDISLTNTESYSHSFKVETILSNDFKSAILPFIDAVENLQREIDRMNKKEGAKA